MTISIRLTTLNTVLERPKGGVNWHSNSNSTSNQIRLPQDRLTMSLVLLSETPGLYNPAQRLVVAIGGIQERCHSRTFSSVLGLAE